jgi:2-dehydro-3-deoxygalactonokinase
VSSELDKPLSLICVDWGTTNLRAYAVANDGSVIEHVENNQGLRNKPDNHADCLKAVIHRWIDDARPVNVLLSGMVGSPTGWQEVPHLPAPATLAVLAAEARLVTRISSCPIWILPGVKGTGISGMPDVLRGEETQFFGAQRLSAQTYSRQPDIWCFPGTHNKWIPSGEYIDHFSTSMVGEFFELIRQHSLLAQSLEQRDIENQPAFLRGIETARKAGGLLHHLFSVRALQLTGAQEKSDGLEYLSGMIIGHDIGAQLSQSGQHVGIVASPSLAHKYQVALEVLGHSSVVIESQAATISGALAINAHLLASRGQPRA